MAKREGNGHVHATCLNENSGSPPRTPATPRHQERRVYTDGSMDPKKKNARAGYGVAVYEADAEGKEKFLSARYGRVVTSPQKTMYQGADRHSNNAGELTALLRAVQEERHKQGRVTFVVDSTYAINMATGRTVPTQRRKSANFGLVTKLRDEYRYLTRKRGEEVRIEHVKSHTGVRGNEAADKLAALGAQIQDGHRIVERNSPEPQMLDAEYKDNG